MINVFSFQKMTHLEDSSEQTNISKTSHFIFGQNYKKLVSNTKASFDFRKFLQKHSNNRKHFATLATREASKRNPLTQVSSTDLGNQQSTLQSKAFKIRCYSRKLAKQNDKDDQIFTSKIIKYKPKIYPARQKLSEKKISQGQIKKCIRMHKFDNFYELQSISNSIKIVYNDFISETDKITDRALLIDMPYLTACMKGMSLKSSQKDRDMSHYRKKVIFLLKRGIQEKYSSFSLQRTLVERPQIIFKVRKQQQISQLLRTLQQCEFDNYYCIFSIQFKYVQSISTYNLTKINNLAQNIIIIDSPENFTSHIALVDSRHFVGFSTVSQKSNFGVAIEQLFHQLDNLQIRFSAEQFVNQDQIYGHITQIAHNQLLERGRQRKNQKECKKNFRQKKHRCHSSYENTYNNQRRNQQKTLEAFKEKMLKYLKIIGSQTTLESKRSKQLPTHHWQDIQCLTGRQRCSKTNNQIVSQLIRLNSHVHKQVSAYQRKMEQVQFQPHQQEVDSLEGLKFQKVYVNTLH